MRKLFFLLVLASGMLVAQPSVTNTQTIGKYLKLSKVPIGLETDNVLVRGSDNIVRYVPKSQFGGGTPTLQQVIDVDGFAYRANNQASILEPDGSGGYSTQFASQSADFSNNQQIYVDKVTAGIQSLSSSSRGYVELSGGRVFIRQTNIFNNLKTEIKINDPLSISNISFPAPPVPGDYTLAIIGTTAPSSSTDTGTFGETRVTSTYVYHCIDTNTWVRQAVEASF